MVKIEEALWENYKKAKNRIDSLNVGSDDYVAASEELDRIRNELIKAKQIEKETEVKRFQIESENKREKTRNRISITTFTITTLVSVYGLWKTFKFDEDATITSTLGKGILNGVTPKLFRR